jgi:hypothetical protein
MNGPHDAGTILHLQRVVGNQHVNRLLRTEAPEVEPEVEQGVEPVPPELEPPRRGILGRILQWLRDLLHIG